MQVWGTMVVVGSNTRVRDGDAEEREGAGDDELLRLYTDWEAAEVVPAWGIVHWFAGSSFHRSADVVADAQMAVKGEIEVSTQWQIEQPGM